MMRGSKEKTIGDPLNLARPCKKKDFAGTSNIEASFFAFDMHFFGRG